MAGQAWRALWWVWIGQISLTFPSTFLKSRFQILSSAQKCAPSGLGVGYRFEFGPKMRTRRAWGRFQILSLPQNAHSAGCGRFQILNSAQKCAPSRLGGTRGIWGCPLCSHGALGAPKGLKNAPWGRPLGLGPSGPYVGHIGALLGLMWALCPLREWRRQFTLVFSEPSQLQTRQSCKCGVMLAD